MASHRANHFNVAYAPTSQVADQAKAAMMAELGIHVHLCGDLGKETRIDARASIDKRNGSEGFGTASDTEGTGRALFSGDRAVFSVGCS